MKILIAEDNEINQKVMRAILEKSGIDYLIVSDGEQVLKELKNDQYRLILMDCQMPILDGYETTKIIRKYEQENNQKRCPIIAITANAMSGDKEKCEHAGMDDFLAKPFKMQQIFDMINKWS